MTDSPGDVRHQSSQQYHSRSTQRHWPPVICSSDRQAIDDNEMQLTDGCLLTSQTDELPYRIPGRRATPVTVDADGDGVCGDDDGYANGRDDDMGGDVTDGIQETRGCLQMRIKDATKKIEYMTLLKDQYSDDITEEEREEFEKSISHYDFLINQWKKKLESPKERATPDTQSGTHKRSTSSTPNTCTSKNQEPNSIEDQKPDARVDTILSKLESVLGLSKIKANIETRLTIILGQVTTRLSKDDSQCHDQYEDIDRSPNLTEYCTADQMLLHFSESDCKISRPVLVEAGLYSLNRTGGDPQMIDRAQLQLQTLTSKMTATQSSLRDAEDALLQTRSLFEDATKKLQMAEALLEDLDNQIDARKCRKNELDQSIKEGQEELEELQEDYDEHSLELDRIKSLKKALMSETEELVGLCLPFRPIHVIKYEEIAKKKRNLWINLRRRGLLLHQKLSLFMKSGKNW